MDIKSLCTVIPNNGGEAMGTKMGPDYPSVFVGSLEEQICQQYTGFIPQLHKRYIDDVVGAASCKREQLDSFIEFVSTFHPAIQFTHAQRNGNFRFISGYSTKHSR